MSAWFGTSGRPLVIHRPDVMTPVSSHGLVGLGWFLVGSVVLTELRLCPSRNAIGAIDLSCVRSLVVINVVATTLTITRLKASIPLNGTSVGLPLRSERIPGVVATIRIYSIRMSSVGWGSLQFIATIGRSLGIATKGFSLGLTSIELSLAITTVGWSLAIATIG